MAEAADRAIALNPRNANTLARIGLILTSSGDYDRGGELIERAMALNPAHPGWYHFALFNRHMARGEFTEALKAARRVNVPDLARMHFAIAAAAGHLGLAREGAAAVQAMVARMPELADDNLASRFRRALVLGRGADREPARRRAAIERVDRRGTERHAWATSARRSTDDAARSAPAPPPTSSAVASPRPAPPSLRPVDHARACGVGRRDGDRGAALYLARG